MQERLREIIADYEYGLFRIAEPDVGIQYSDHDSGLFIGPKLYEFTGPRKYGICHELAAKAKPRIEQAFPDLHIITAVGADGKFFRQRHHYLLASERKLLRTASTIDQRSIDAVLRANPWIVDPTFGRVQRFSDSGYTASYLEQRHEESHTEQSLWHGVAIPLGIAGDSLVSIVGWQEFPHRAGIGIRNGKPKIYDPVRQHPALQDQLRAYPKLARCVAAIREKLARS